MGTYRSPLAADMLGFCYERDMLLDLFCSGIQLNVMLSPYLHLTPFLSRFVSTGDDVSIS